MSAEKTKILGSEISVWNLEETSKKVLELARAAKPSYVCVSNVHTVVMGSEDPSYERITNSAALATADGVPLIWASRLLKTNPIHGRASGPDIMFKMTRETEFAELKHYFYGSSPDVLNQLIANLKASNPKIQIAGFASPPIRGAAALDAPMNAGEIADIEVINQSGANIIWVGLGAPKQEIWMYRAQKYLKQGVCLGVGAAFDFLSGNKSRAPLWMQKAGLEWAHRMLSEPGRLTSRYLKTNPKFVAAVMKQALLGK